MKKSERVIRRGLNRCKISISQQVHELLIEERNEWLILGDETGGLSGLEDKKTTDQVECFGLQFPKTTLPPFIRCTMVKTLSGLNETHKALQNLNNRLK